MPTTTRQFQIDVYNSSLDVPQYVIDIMRGNEPNANCILPILLKSRQAEGRGQTPPRKQCWLVCSTPTPQGPASHRIDFVLAITEGIIDSYPAFFFSSLPPHQLSDDFVQPRMMQMAYILSNVVPAQRIYSVFALETLARTFVSVWTRLTGIQSIDTPYYAAKISYCTSLSFREREMRPLPDGLVYEIRPGVASDMMEVAQNNFGFASDSAPFSLTQDGAICEATYLLQRNQVWVHRIAKEGEPREVASIVAFTRNSETNATITKVYTNPRWRQLGCAERLVREVTRFLLRSKRTVSLYVAHNNPGAAHVYSRVGFVGLGAHEGPVFGVDNWVETGFDMDKVQLGHW